jgi:anion-transporting  ArsA/GET3 family ATPase
LAEVHVVCGVGGVGKTTTAAALGAGLARRGRRVVVLTIDPARRLADALGATLHNDPTRIALPDASGELWALMLDRQKQFDQVVARHAADADAARRLLANRYYRAVSARLTGAHEFMAVEKLLDLSRDLRFDAIVVDTPPTRHALDFLKAPDRVRKVLDPSALGALAKPGKGLWSRASQRVLQVFQRIAGDSVLADLREFVTLFGDYASGFSERGAAVERELHAASYWLVLGADAPDRDDAVLFVDDLRTRRLRIGGLVVNRVRPAPGPAPIPDWARPDAVPADQWSSALVALRDAHAAEVAQAHREAGAIERVAARIPEARVRRVAERPDGLDGIRELAAVGDELLGAR